MSKSPIEAFILLPKLAIFLGTPLRGSHWIYTQYIMYIIYKYLFYLQQWLPRCSRGPHIHTRELGIAYKTDPWGCTASPPHALVLAQTMTFTSDYTSAPPPLLCTVLSGFLWTRNICVDCYAGWDLQCLSVFSWPIFLKSRIWKNINVSWNTRKDILTDKSSSRAQMSSDSNFEVFFY